VHLSQRIQKRDLASSAGQNASGWLWKTAKYQKWAICEKGELSFHVIASAVIPSACFRLFIIYGPAYVAVSHC
jgi:hypothetical protein